jgi:hypothetical protein
MEPVPCLHCAAVFVPRNRKQYYCSRSECQRARKTAWQQIKMKTDPEYRADQRLSWKKWALNHPGYWKAYRRNNPEKDERNRILQTIRNRRRTAPANGVIAKMDARKCHGFKPLGRFYLVPLIAKMDVTKVNIYTIADTWK